MSDRKTILEAGWNFDNSYARLPKLFYSPQKPTPVPLPKLIILNHSLATSLGLDIKALQSDDSINIFAGNLVPEEALPISQAYAGHQFGHFTMLGDGRAVLIGEQITPSGDRFDVQLKGSGRTPYSRGGDGRAALGPMLREYIISEAMHGLGIATTRSLAVVTTGESIIRETELLGAILTRIASSHIRVGTFQYIANWGTASDLQKLADYTLKRHFPEAQSNENPYVLLLREVINRQAILIAKWQLVGFIHGVMNTDNMAISGETIDYGPCAFMDKYDPATVFSSIDLHGRYAYGNQPSIAEWNLTRFAETLLPLLHKDEKQAINIAQNELLQFAELYHSNWLAGMRAKLGMFDEEVQDESLIKSLLDIMHKHGADYTNTFRALTFSRYEGIDMFSSTEYINWNEKWQSRLEIQKKDKGSVKKLMMDSNPAVIPRNHRVEDALEAAVKQGDYSVMVKLLDVLSRPYDHSSKQEEYSQVPQPSVYPYRTFCGT